MVCVREFLPAPGDVLDSWDTSVAPGMISSSNTTLSGVFRGATWRLPKLGVPYWGPCYRGSYYLGIFFGGVPFFRKPPMRAGNSKPWQTQGSNESAAGSLRDEEEAAQEVQASGSRLQERGGGEGNTLNPKP